MSQTTTCRRCGEQAVLWVYPVPEGCIWGFPDHCPGSLAMARAEAARRKVAPEFYGTNGELLDPATLGQVHLKMLQAGVDFHTGLPIPPPQGEMPRARRCDC